jgi:peroxiredoxin
MGGGVAFLRRRGLFVAVGLALAGLLAVFAFAMLRGRPDEAAGAPLAGDLDFSTPAFSGAAFHLGDHARGPVFVYFWASWCTPCEAEAPLIQQLWPEYQKRGYTFVGVNIWDADKDAHDFVTQHALTFPVVSDPGGKIYLAYGVQQLPMAFFLRPTFAGPTPGAGAVAAASATSLEVQQRYLGQLDEKQLRQLLDGLART